VVGDHPYSAIKISVLTAVLIALVAAAIVLLHH